MRFITNNDANNLQLVQVEPRGPSQLIEVAVTTVTSKINFPDISNLRNESDQIVIIKAIRLIVAGVLSNAPTLGFVTAPDSEIIKTTLVLYSEGWEKGQLIPTNILNDMTVPGGNAPYKQLPTKFDSWSNLDWSKSFIQFSNGTASAPGDDGYAFLFDVEYVKMRKDPNNEGGLIEIIGPN